MARIKGPTHYYHSTQQSIQRFIDRTADYVKVVPVDPERTIYLISTIKGDGNFRDFAAAAGTTAASVSRIFNEITLSLGHEIIAGFAAAAESSGVVDLDMLMEAQGRVRKDHIEAFRAKAHSIIRQIITDELLSGGYILSAQTEEHRQDPGFSIQLKESNRDEKLWSFRSMLYLLNQESDLLLTCAEKWLVEAKNNVGADYQSLVIDNETIFREIVKAFSKRKTDRPLSVNLVSILERRVVDEFIIPSTDGDCMQRIINSQRIYEPVKSKPPKKLFSNNPETIIPQLRWDDCRRIIANALLQKGYQLNYEGRNSITLPFIQIEPDVVMEIRKPGESVSRWVFNIKSFQKKADHSEALKDIGDWLTKTMAYYYQGGYMSRFSLVVDDQEVYDSVVDMLKHIMISGEISLLLVSPEKNKILSEFIIPQKFSRNDLIRLV